MPLTFRSTKTKNKNILLPSGEPPLDQQQPSFFCLEKLEKVKKRGRNKWLSSLPFINTSFEVNFESGNSKSNKETVRRTYGKISFFFFL